MLLQGINRMVSYSQELQKNPFALFILVPILIFFLRLLFNGLRLLKGVLFGGSGSFSTGLFMPSRVQGAIRSYGVVELKGRRPYMEDRHLVAPFVRESPECTLYGVFDGHGGDAASQFCVDHFGSVLATSPIDPRLSPNKALSYAFKQIDSRFLEIANLRKMDDGTTCIVALFNGRQISVANAGDSRCIVVHKSGCATALSNDHKPDRNDERDRIGRLGGSVIHWGVWRVEGVLAVSRAIGDRLLKEYVIPDPEISTHQCAKEDLYLVLATDGLWDVVDNDQVGQLICKCKTPQEAAEVLTQEAFAKGTMDNVTVLVVDLSNASAFNSKTMSRVDSDPGQDIVECNDGVLEKKKFK